MTAGWGTIDVSSSKLLLGPTVSGHIWTPPYGTWLSLVKQELADEVTASICFMLPKIVSLPQMGVWMLSYNILDRVALCHAHIGWSATTEMKSVLQTVPSRIVVTSTFVSCVHSILRLSMFIIRQFIVLTASARAEAGHLLWGSHGLHHCSPKAASPDHHFQACLDDFNMRHRYINVAMITYTRTPPLSPTHLYLTLYVSIITYYVSTCT